ncbi:MAG: SGNH/GDSL hydrolase family protein [Woeseiaceae bacterium]
MNCRASLSFPAILALLAVSACQIAPSAPGQSTASPGWVGSWASAQQIPELRNALPAADLDNATLRQVIRVTLGGERIRLRVSNVYGTAPLTIGETSIARSVEPNSAGIDPRTLKVTFSNQKSVTVPAGAYVLSDPFRFSVEPLTHLSVSLYFPQAPQQQTGHPGSRATSYLLPGNRVKERMLPDAKQADHWYQLAGLDVEATGSSRALVVIGDSITDGFGVQPNTDQRWTDFLISRVQADPELQDRLAVLNVGLGGNRLLLDGLGPNGLARFDRDVLNRPGAAHVIVLLGVNDVGMLSREEGAEQRDYDNLVARMPAAYEQMIMRAREKDIRIIGATIMPFAGSTFYPSNEMAEAARQTVNAWIRKPGTFDAVVDFDALMRSPDDPSRLNPAYDSGDHLHPSIAGYQAMAEFVSLDLFKNPL